MTSPGKMLNYGISKSKNSYVAIKKVLTAYHIIKIF